MQLHLRYHVRRNNLVKVKDMNLACCVWAINTPENDMLQRVKDIGFEWIDIQPQMLQEKSASSLSQSLNLNVSCVGASFNLPDGATLSNKNERLRKSAIDHVKTAMIHAQSLGADCIYVIPDMDSSSHALQHYATSIEALAEQAKLYHLRLCIEHFPGRALPTAKSTLDFIHQINHANLYLLLDCGHLQMSSEDFGITIREAGDKLGYVHLDDNDGEYDLHWSLLDGVMTESSLQQLFITLQQINYTGAISLELSPQLENPVDALIRSRDIVLNYL